MRKKNYSDHFYVNENQIDEKNNKNFWSVWRQDDHGNVFLVKNGLTETESLRLVREFERKGHKQTYWAKKSIADF